MSNEGVSILVFLAIAAIFVLVSYITTLRNAAERGRKSAEDASSYYHQLNDVKSKNTLAEKAWKTANEALKEETERKLDAITERCRFFQEACKKRSESEPWLATYLAEIETAIHLDEVKRRERSAPITAEKLKSKIINEYRPALLENKLLKQRLVEYDLLFPAISEHVEKIELREDDVLEDGGRSWLSDEEFRSKTDAEKNQLILDRYLEGHRKSKWQIGRDYELYIGHVFHLKEYTGVIQYGIEKKLEDLGIDIIANNPKTGRTAYIQCKNWSQNREIRENTVTQLYAGALIHALHNNQSPALIDFHICTSTTASELAKKCATILGVHIHENIPLGKYPAIKCKAGTDQDGLYTRIYHLPIDQMYDRTYITGENDFYAWTTEEAESRDFRRAFRWRGGDGIQ